MSRWSIGGWSADDDARMRELYPHASTVDVARQLGRTVAAVYGRAANCGLHKSAEYLASPAACRLRRGGNVGVGTRFQPGHPPANKGLRRPGWGPGRMKETQFKKGQISKRWDSELYTIGALRLNADGYVDMKVHDGPRGWRAFHVILWEDVNGPVPPGYTLCFKDRDKLNVDVANLELVSRADLCRRNSIHNLPPEIRGAVTMLGALKRRIRREEQDRRSA